MALDIILRDNGAGTFDIYFGIVGVPTTKTYIIDLVTKALNTTKNYNINVLFKKLNTTKIYSLDVVFKKLDTTNTYSLDIIIKKSANVIGTSTWGMATAYPLQRKTFYANGRYWAFYTNGTNLVYNTSTDGITWDDTQTVRACLYGEFFSIWFDGIYVHYAYASGSLYYRRGTPQSNGIISWSADEQTVSTTYNAAYYPFVSVDTLGYAWIGYIDSSGGYHPYVIKSGNNNGTWGTTPTGFPYLLSATTGSFCVEIIPLTNSKMLAVYVKFETPIKAKRWTGTEWGIEKSVTSNIKDDYAFSAVAKGDDVHLVFLKLTPNNIIYVKYTYTSDLFGVEVTVQASVTADSYPTLSIRTAKNILYCFWAGSPTANHIYYKKYIDEIWSANPIDWIDESIDSLTSYQELTSFYEVGNNNKIGLLYETKSASPYNVKFGNLTLEEMYSLDAIFKKLNEVIAYLIDVNFITSLNTYTKEYLLDVILKQPNTIKNYLIDATIKKLDELKTYSLDVTISSKRLSAYLLDVIIKQLDIIKIYPLDIVFKKLDTMRTYILDVVMNSRDKETIYSLDVALKQLDTLKTYILDVIVFREDIKTYSMDVIFSRLNDTTNYLSDVSIVDRITSVYLFDVLIGQIIKGITKDSGGQPLGNCTVWLFRTYDKLYIAETISDDNGNYYFVVNDDVTNYFVRTHKDGSPNVFGTSDRNLIGVTS
jgi:hypothetical protein